MQLKRVIPPPVVIDHTKRPQCSVAVPPPSHNPTWRRDHYSHSDPERCQRLAYCFIDDKPYCRLHAGQIVLETMLDGTSKEG